jgi:hypothetical protein
MLSGDQKFDLRNVCDFSGGAYRFEFSWKGPIDIISAVTLSVIRSSRTSLL